MASCAERSHCVGVYRGLSSWAGSAGAGQEAAEAFCGSYMLPGPVLHSTMEFNDSSGLLVQASASRGWETWTPR